MGARYNLRGHCIDDAGRPAAKLRRRLDGRYVLIYFGSVLMAVASFLLVYRWGTAVFAALFTAGAYLLATGMHEYFSSTTELEMEEGKELEISSPPN